jgi:hypothetical protein
MDWPKLLSGIVVPKGDLNQMRWQGQPGHYEAWYLTFNSREHRLGFWLRYTLDVPFGARPFRELWAHVFDARSPDRSFGLRKRFVADSFLPPAHCLAAAGEARLEEGCATGRLVADGHGIEWDLEFAPDPCAVHLAPNAFRALGLGSTEVVFANPDARLRGQVLFDGRRIDLDGEPGGQTHLWGKKHAERWAWGHCNAFGGRDDCALDGVAAYLPRLGKLRGPISGIYVRYRGDDYCLNALPWMLFTRSEIALPSWRFTGYARGLKFVGTFEVRRDRLLQVTYEDPDGERSYCANSEVADLRLEIWRGGRLLDRLGADGTAHLEFGARQPWPEVRATV